MKTVILAVVLLAAIGLIAGLLLAIASIVMAVPVNKKEEEIRAVLPGANCGSCGYSGCDGYANALANGAKITTLCNPGGEDVAKQIAEILGVEAGEMKKTVAVVSCRGNCDNVKQSFEYDGVTSCAMANQLQGGPNACKYGCIGFGDCAKACDRNAINVCNGVAVVDQNLCGGCQACAKVCPKGIIKMETIEEQKVFVYCVNADKGAKTRKDCTAGCIGCMKCQKACEFGAVTVTNFHASVDTSKCQNCGKCITECPTGCISELIR